ncbi:MAG TPA: threonine-phosphate decarboxylase CobD [Paracoccaceae bacterium]
MRGPETPEPAAKPDHGGGIDAAAARFGGRRDDWVDLSTGINPRHYPVPALSADAWAALPDEAAQQGLVAAARAFWRVPETAAVLAAPGASALIALMPLLAAAGRVRIAQPTYNEHGRAFRACSWQVVEGAGEAEAQVLVHPNNPDGRLWTAVEDAPLTVLDESFCDVTPEASLVQLASRPGVVVLKSFGKFWGLAGLRLGFALGDPGLIGRLAAMLGPWPVSGPALAIGTAALRDPAWAQATRVRLAADAARLDRMLCARGAGLAGGTSLFRLYDVADAGRWQAALAQHHIWTRVFPYSARWLRLGLPGSPDGWTRLETALQEVPEP